ncbi:endonuclease/exonuclease/phosphatase family protein [Bythopirellula goksoeyrii]|uniref:Endonuclease/Exonuclease/phosphatase family protein n=1 Tax=Bythopirellula goksoeyrii TaxID=1400387 RepID=A0A5B9QLB0_9BACT|nr:endonuclease/exonuclease/phosphatase family protein [Bythopirellula goksoeyrii]QEG37846.1 Endonuclease/Exonuclease/phosphatase family protein [Bythopirellula goksoeyrii]
MQRILSLGTLALIGWLGYTFLQGGGLEHIATQSGASQQNSPQAGTQYRSPGNWNAPPTDSSPYQPASTGNNGAIQPPGQPNSGPVIRIASFNVQALGNTKAGKQHVMVRLADIIRKFDIVAIQEIRSSNDYLVPNFVQLVNNPGGNFPQRRYDHIIGPRVGRTTNQEQFLYLFDTERIEVDRQSVYTISDPDDLLFAEPLVATFTTRGVHPDEAFTFTVVNNRTDPVKVNDELDALAEVYRVVRRSARQEDDVILVGDFHSDDRHLYRLGQMPGIFPTIAGVWTNTRQDNQYDNLIIHQPSTTEYTGRSGVFDVMRNYNLTEQQALEISDHFPVWAEFSVYERDYQGRVANRRLEGTRR